jgi:hypothetical protein
MAKTEDELKRFFVKLAPDLHRELKVLAIREGTNVELLGGRVLADWIKAQAESKRAKR